MISRGEKAMKKTFMTIGLLSLSPFALAQNYSATVGDLNTIFDPPSNIQGIICQSTSNDGNEHSYKACSDGVASARYMAEKYAQSAGKYLGCLDGFYQGVWDGYLSGKNPTQAMLDEANTYISQARLDSAETRASSKAQSEATTESADQIISRYRKVVGVKDAQGRHVLPNKSYQVPPITFKGFTDGYEHDIQNGRVSGLNFRDAQNAGWVNANASFEDKIAAQRAYMLQGEYAKNLCNPNQTIFGRRGMPTLTIWDYFNARREYNFSNYGWNNESWAWDYFLNDERNLDHYQNFEGVKNLEKTVIVKTPITQRQEQIKRDANGQPVQKRDQAGNLMTNTDGTPIYETVFVDVVVGYKDETKRVKLDANEVKVLQGIYGQAFKDSYGRYYAKQYASREYHKEGLEKYGTAKLIGKFIGEDVARHTAKREAYNRQYQTVSATKYAELAKDLYIKSFNRLIKIFETNPVMELNSFFVIGDTNDGIFRPGEGLSFDYQVTNLGEVARPVTLSLQSTSDVIAQATHTIMPSILDRQQGSTSILGSIANDVYPDENVNLSFRLNNPSNLDEVDRGLVVNKSQNIMINDYAEIKNVSTYLDETRGDLTINVQIKNPASIANPAFPTVEILIDGTREVITKNVEKLEAGEVKPVGISIRNIDPLSIIGTNKISGTVSVRMAGKVIHSKQFSVSVTSNVDSMIAHYFHGLASETNTNTGGETLEKRIGRVMTMIEQSLDHDLANSKIRWKRQNVVDGTIIGLLQKEYAAGQNAGEIRGFAQDNYDRLAKVLAKRVNNKGYNRIRGFDSKFLAQLQKFSPSLSTKKRHHKS